MTLDLEGELRAYANPLVAGVPPVTAEEVRRRGPSTLRARRRRRTVALVAVVAVAALVAAVVATSGSGQRRLQVGLSSPPLAVTAALPLASGGSMTYADGSLWIAGYQALWRVDPATAAVTARFALPSDGIPPYVAAAGGKVWETREGAPAAKGSATPYDEWLVEIDPASDRIVRRILLPATPTGMAAGYGRLWILLAGPSGSQVTPVDALTGKLGTPIAVTEPGSIAAGAGAVWVATTQRVLKIDPVSDRTSSLPPPTAYTPFPSDVVTGDGAVWVVATGWGMAKVDPMSWRLEGYVGGVDDVAVGPGSLWVVTDVSSAVQRLDPVTLRPLSRPVSVAGVLGIAVTPAGPWVATDSSGVVRLG